MSRITKFLKQTCLWDSRTGLNKYGENEYAPPEEVKCRRETFTRDVVDTNGFIIKSASRYFLDDTVEVKAGDRIDGFIVFTVEEYINEHGNREGFEIYVERSFRD